MKKIIIFTVLVIVLIAAVLFVNLLIFEKSAEKVTKGNPIATYQDEKSALLVIDIQEYTTGKLAADTNYIKVSDSMITLVNRMIDSARVNEIPVIYVRSEVTNMLVNLLNSSMAKGSAGVANDKRLHVVSDFDITKQKQDAFSNSRLDSILIENHVNKLYITGLDAAFCVNSTIQAALNRGYKITVIGDAVISKTDSLRTKMFDEYSAKGVNIINSEEFYKIRN